MLVSTVVQLITSNVFKARKLHASAQKRDLLLGVFTRRDCLHIRREDVNVMLERYFVEYVLYVMSFLVISTLMLYYYYLKLTSKAQFPVAKRLVFIRCNFFTSFFYVEGLDRLALYRQKWKIIQLILVGIHNDLLYWAVAS